LLGKSTGKTEVIKKMQNPIRNCAGATLLELAVVVGMVAILSTVAFQGWNYLQERSREIRCSGTLRQLALGVLSYSVDHGGQLPRSSHSAAAAVPRQRGWMREIFPYLGQDQNAPNTRYREILAQYFRCPSDKTRTSGSSYGLNVFFELDPEYDDYEGNPQTWKTLASLPHPGRTILLAEVPSSADHVMAHFWGSEGYGGDVASTRHRNRSHYAFADGHLELLSVEKTFHQKANLWHPDLSK